MSSTGIQIYSILIQILGVLALACLAGTVAGIPAVFSARGRRSIVSFFGDADRPMRWALVIAATAMMGSLYLSEIVGFVPCRLCWYQRFAMYPLVPILAILLMLKRTDGWGIGLVFALVGVTISGIHVFEQMNPEISLIPCGTGVACSARYVAVFGFISIPVLAGSAFLAIITLMLSTAVCRRAASETDAVPAAGDATTA